MNYSFPASVGEEYTITIWARLGTQNNRPAFANWSGFNGFSTTLINNVNWTEYTWTLTATNSNPVIRIYAAPFSGAQIGDEVLIDNVSIVAVNSDTEPPSVPANLQASNIGETSLDLSWDASTDNVGVTDYEVFQDDVSLGQTGGATEDLRPPYSMTCNDSVGCAV